LKQINAIILLNNCFSIKKYLHLIKAYLLGFEINQVNAFIPPKMFFVNSISYYCLLDAALSPMREKRGFMFM
jgi:hypothetical protein